MKAIVCTAYGEPKNVLKVIQIPKPSPKPNELLIEIYSAALNPIDYILIKGWLKIKIPWIPGRDFAGRVLHIGAKTNQNKLKQKGIKVGTFVCGMTSHLSRKGTLAEYMCITPEYCEPFPINKLSCNQASSIPMAGMTAYQALIGKAGLKSGGKVLILGGSGGCGVYGIQIAKIYGAKEIAVTSSQEVLCKSLGADIVLNYKDKNVPIWYEKFKGQNYDVIFDCVGEKDSFDNAYKILSENGTFVDIVRGVLGKIAPNYVFLLANPTSGLSELMREVQKGTLKAVLDDLSPYNLENFIEMFEKQMSHTAHGKLVLEFKTFDAIIKRNLISSKL